MYGPCLPYFPLLDKNFSQTKHAKRIIKKQTNKQNLRPIPTYIIVHVFEEWQVTDF